MKAIIKKDIFDPVFGMILVPALSLVELDIDTHWGIMGYYQGVYFSVKPSEYFPYPWFGTVTKEQACLKFETETDMFNE